MITTELIVIIIVVFIIFTAGSMLAFAGMACGCAAMLTGYVAKTTGESNEKAKN
jgi:hypothetical protein